MNFKEIKDELKTILQGKSQVSHGELIQTISLYHRRSKETSALVEAKQYSKKEETEKLIQFINAHNLWVCDIDFDLFISQGRNKRFMLKMIEKY